MKKVLLIFAMLVSMLLPARAHDALRVTPVGGEPVIIHFDDSPEVNFTATGIRLTCTSAEPVTFDFEEIESMDFASLSAAESVEAANEISLRMTSQSLLVANAPENSHISIFTIDGKEVFSATFSDNICVERNRIPKGVSVVRINNSAFKITL